METVINFLVRFMRSSAHAPAPAKQPNANNAIVIRIIGRVRCFSMCFSAPHEYSNLVMLLRAEPSPPL
jgi:hypothetical protein